MKTNSSVEMETVSEVLGNVIGMMTVKTTQTKKDVLVRKFFWVSKNDQTENFVRGENNILMSHTAQRHAHVLKVSFFLKDPWFLPKNERTNSVFFLNGVLRRKTPFEY